ncbi:hypothetical protein [Desulfovibrio aminophilus]|uniref:hypothetical protein n=1 Tax=Desulfovibrio aminophilus TaxID=81425 RepID=UPI003397CBB6
MKRIMILLVAALCLCLGAITARAGGLPDLKGDWTCVSKPVVMGKLGHREPATSPVFSEGVAFTLRITAQDGERFYGERFSAKHKETVLGMIDEDGTMTLVDDDGIFIGSYDKATDRLKLRYMEPGKDSKVVSVGIYTRKK